MDKYIIDRVNRESDYLIETKETIREIAKVFDVSKSTAHKDLHERLLELDQEKFKEIKDIFEEHIATRHIKGGESTRKKYLKSL